MRFAALALLFASLGTSGGAAGLTAQTPLPLSPAEGLHLMRVVLSVEASLPFGRNGFGTLSDVLANSPAQLGATAIDLDTASLRDYTLRIIRSEDKRHFVAALTPIKGCGPAWFASETDVIYPGKALGC